MQALMEALKQLFDLPNWENRGDQGDVRASLAALHAEYQRAKTLSTSNGYWLLTREQCNGESCDVDHYSLHFTEDDARAEALINITPAQATAEGAVAEWEPSHESGVYEYRVGLYGYTVWKVRGLAPTSTPIIERCKLPPAGWRCTRYAGHKGPCAAWPVGCKKC